LSDFTNKALEWQLADQKLSALLVLSDFTVKERKLQLRFHRDEIRNNKKIREIVTVEQQFQGDNGEAS
jgi:hypothetical protein